MSLWCRLMNFIRWARTPPPDVSEAWMRNQRRLEKGSNWRWPIS